MIPISFTLYNQRTKEAGARPVEITITTPSGPQKAQTTLGELQMALDILLSGALMTPNLPSIVANLMAQPINPPPDPERPR